MKTHRHRQQYGGYQKEGVGGSNRYIVTEDLTLSDGHTMQHTDDVSQNCALESYKFLLFTYCIVLLTSVTPINLIDKREKERFGLVDRHFLSQSDGRSKLVSGPFPMVTQLERESTSKFLIQLLSLTVLPHLICYRQFQCTQQIYYQYMNDSVSHQFG